MMCGSGTKTGMSSTPQKFDSVTYSRKNLYALMMFWNACSDYVAARCCLLNGLFSGLPLASQAVEKIIKSFIFLTSGEETKGHDPYELKTKLKSSHKDAKLDSFDPVLQKLSQHFQSRYHDNPNQPRTRSPRELPEIDELFVYLLDTLPVPEEVKFNTYFFHALFNPTVPLPDRQWALRNNPPLQAKMPALEAAFRRTYEDLHGPLERRLTRS
jgi:HEPN domain-containing protein